MGLTAPGYRRSLFALLMEPMNCKSIKAYSVEIEEV